MALRVGQSRIFPGLEDSRLETQAKATGATRRTFFGLVEAGGSPVKVRVSVSFVGSAGLSKVPAQGSRVHEPPADGFLRARRIVPAIFGPDRDALFDDLIDVTAEFTVIESIGSHGLHLAGRQRNRRFDHPDRVTVRGTLSESGHHL